MTGSQQNEGCLHEYDTNNDVNEEYSYANVDMVMYYII